jgi:phage/plasmid-like protein (TIGR03299 family)
MSHELERLADGGTAFASARQHAWHRLGTVLPDAFTASQAMEHARLGWWNVRKEHLQAVVVTADGVSTIDVPDRYATVRTNPVTGQPEALGVVGASYVPIQNEEHCDLLDALVDESGAHFETAGSLKGGRQVFISMKLPDTMQVGGIDPVDTYLTACNSHDGSMAFRLMVTPVRVVCANTLAAAIRSAKASFSIHHTTGARSQIQAARDALGLTFRYMGEFQAEAERMLDTTMTDAQFRALIQQLWPVKDTEASVRTRNNTARRDSDLTYLWHDADTQKAIRGTRWAGYQAVTEYLDHYTPVGANRDTGKVRAERAISDATTALKARAFDLLTVTTNGATGATGATGTSTDLLAA